MKDFLATFGQFSEEEVHAFEAIGLARSVAAKTGIFQGDRPFRKLFFIQTGIIRAFRLIDGEDFTYFFFVPLQVFFTCKIVGGAETANELKGADDSLTSTIIKIGTTSNKEKEAANKGVYEMVLTREIELLCFLFTFVCF